MDKIMYYELAKWAIVALTIFGCTYLVTDTIRVNKARELKVRIKELKEDK